MANFVFNNAKGRIVELYNRVKTNDPVSSALIIVVLSNSGIENDSILKDYDFLSDVLVNNSEATNSGYSRKVLTDVDISSFSPDDVNDRVDLDIPDQTWPSVQVGDVWSKMLVCYDPDTATGNDSTVLPLTSHDLPVIPDGSDIIVQIPIEGFLRVS